MTTAKSYRYWIISCIKWCDDFIRSPLFCVRHKLEMSCDLFDHVERAASVSEKLILFGLLDTDLIVYIEDPQSAGLRAVKASALPSLRLVNLI